MKNTRYNIKDFAPCSNEISSSHIPIDRITIGKGRYAIPLPDGIRLFEGDFVEKSLNIADKSVDLIFTDPPYDLKSLPLYQELAKVAERVLKEGGSLVTYCGQDHKYQIHQFMESSGLTPRREFAVIYTGRYARIYKKQALEKRCYGLSRAVKKGHRTILTIRLYLQYSHLKLYMTGTNR